MSAASAEPIWSEANALGTLADDKEPMESTPISFSMKSTSIVYVIYLFSLAIKFCLLTGVTDRSDGDVTAT